MRSEARKSKTKRRKIGVKSGKPNRPTTENEGHKGWKKSLKELTTSNGLVNINGIKHRLDDLQSVFNRSHIYRKGTGLPPRLAMLMVVETQIGPTQKPQIKGAKMFHARDKRKRKGDTNIYLGGVSIIVRDDFVAQTYIAPEVPARDNILWLKTVTTDGTWVTGAAYSRPNHPKEHKRMMEDLASDIAKLRQDIDIMGICL